MMKKHFHFIGIGGSGLSAIARLLLERGHTVSGSDRTSSNITRELGELGIAITIGHAPENIHGADVIIRSSAIQDDNPEVVAAHAIGIPVLKRADFLEQMIGSDTCIAVAGSHGKTTTTAMIAWALTSLHQDPSFIIGGISKNLAVNAHAGKGETFVIEADEYDFMFLGLRPDWAILTNIDYDHPDCYPSRTDYQLAFGKFIQRVKPQGHLLFCSDDPILSSIVSTSAPQNCNTLSYGFIPSANYWAGNLKPNTSGCFDFDVWCHRGGETAFRLTSISLSIPGKHNVLNALATLALLHQMRYPVESARNAIHTFAGTARRFEIVGEVNGITLIDDYAHHPAEIRATLQAARNRYPAARIWAIWQPHTFSRIRALLDEFKDAFEDADRVIVTEIYAAREKENSLSSSSLASQISHPHVHFAPDFKTATNLLLQELQAGDVVITLSAGDANQICFDIYQTLRAKEVKNA
ncbi:MAG: UDP-N-acetylmuramate--L-alanine ligase [Anaerolineae bacterium]|nr:UDP-N-acetylmuramate--L-alanine ligase [Anaerolineae bacterium]